MGEAGARENDEPMGQITVMTTPMDHQQWDRQKLNAESVHVWSYEKRIEVWRYIKSKMGCLCPRSNVQPTGQPGETEERPGPVSNHSTQNLQAYDGMDSGSNFADVSGEKGNHLDHGGRSVWERREETQSREQAYREQTSEGDQRPMGWPEEIEKGLSSSKWGRKNKEIYNNLKSRIITLWQTGGRQKRGHVSPKTGENKTRLWL